MVLIRLFYCVLFVILLAGFSWAAAGQTQALTLDDCLKIVMQKSSELAHAKTELLVKDMGRKSTRKDLFPSLSMQYGYTRYPDALPSVAAEDYYNYLVSVEQPLYRGKSLVTAVELGDLAMEYARSSLAATTNSLTVRVHEAYFNVLKNLKLEEVADQAVLRLESHRKDAKAFYEAGLIPKNDLLTSEVQLAQGHQDLLAAQNNLSLAKAALNIMMKRPVDTPLLINDVLALKERSVAWEETLARALVERPEMAQTRIAVEQADKSIILARAPYLPAVSLSASYKKQGDSPGISSYPFGDNEVRWAQATMQWRFWAWGQRRNKEAEARYESIKANKFKELTEDIIILEVRRAFLDLQQAEENIKVTNKAVEQSEENYRINEARYQAQLTTSTEVLDAQSLLTQARTNYYNSLYDFNIATARLDWATGTLAASIEQ